MVIRHLEIIKVTSASLGFGKTFLRASYNTFLRPISTSRYHPCQPILAAVEEERKTLCNEKELHDMREDAKKKRSAPPSRNISGSV